MEALPPEFDKLITDLSDDQRQKLMSLESIYRNWNAKINVISRKDMDAFAERHLFHSLAMRAFWNPAAGQKVVDIGTGGGFPGIPLAICHPDVSFLLVDSTAKKIKVIKDVADSLDLKNVEALHARAEEVKGNFDFALSRAVARLSVLVRYCVYSKMKVRRLLCLKGGDLKDEIAEIKRFPVKVHALSEHFGSEYFETKKLVGVDFQGRR